MKLASIQEVLAFWLDELSSEQRFSKDSDVDEHIRERFWETWKAATAGELWSWRDSLQGRLAEIIVLDQFSRNLWREDCRAFDQDGMALVLCQEMLRQEGFADLSETEKQFALLPMMHSESLIIQDASLPLFKQHTNDNTLDFAQRHRDIVAEFGRFPHRNFVLGRPSSMQEVEFLQKPGSSF
ncbi:MULTISPECIES: DUF924 family protein [Vitreoscilla]|uniref:DUF924 domain-containing protein n=1 Tax=Vitreoscilla stercoraria TaxID=61 RepID=A0ABY4E724_VITST|nr:MULTISPECIES: DUF924 family protein [Vitreoscilla]AUZ04769.1 hypothetical protein ADP71_10910 [Vitreoscilla sp. C1]UOO91555.1 DUF924 domain-containing protein [Vitreoscilla stercoraria]